MLRYLTLIFLIFTIFRGDSLCQSFEYELDRIKKEKKPAILYFYSRYCLYCEFMEKNVILNNDVRRAMESKVALIWVDGDSRKDLMRNYGVFGFPTIVLLDPLGNSLGQVPGYIHKERFLKIVSYLADGHYRRIPLKRFLEKRA